MKDFFSSHLHEIPLMEQHGSECVLFIRLLLPMTTSETSQIIPDHLNPNSRQTMKMRKIRERERHYYDKLDSYSAFICSTLNWKYIRGRKAEKMKKSRTVSEIGRFVAPWSEQWSPVSCHFMHSPFLSVGCSSLIHYVEHTKLALVSHRLFALFYLTSLALQ